MAATRQRRNINARLDEDFIPWASIADSEEEEIERDRNLIESLVLVDNGEEEDQNTICELDLDFDDNDKWAILGDKGPREDTPTIRRVFIKSDPRNETERNRNTLLSRVRCPVERFFGRMKQLFKLLRQPYKFCHSTFDMHVNNMILLTNEHFEAI